MTTHTIKFKRGIKSKLNELSYGEPAYISDENELYIGTEDGVEKITRNKEVAELNSQLEHKASLDELNVERKRIDSFISLEQGSTTGDAELIDARIGANGKTYTNLGNAIRETTKELNRKVEKISPLNFNSATIYNYFNKNDYETESGYYYTTNGVKSANASYSYIKFPILSNKTYECKIFGNAYLYSWILQDGEGNFISSVTPSLANSIYTLTVPDNFNKIVYLAISYKNTFDVDLFQVNEQSSNNKTNEYKAIIPWLVSNELSDSVLEDINKTIENRLPLPIPVNLIDNVKTDNYADKSKVVTGYKYTSSNTVIEDVNYSYVEVELDANSTYVDIFYNSERLLFDKDMKFIKRIAPSEYNNSLKTAKYTIDGDSNTRRILVVNFVTSAYGKNIAVYKSDDVTIKKPYSKFEYKSDLVCKGVSEFGVTESSVKQNLYPYVLDGVGCTNYWDSKHNIENHIVSDDNYTYSAINYLPSGTYTINNAYSLDLIAKDGTSNTIVCSNTAKTFEITEDYPYYRALIRTRGDIPGVFNNIIIQKGTTINGITERKYTFENFKVEDVGYYPTHWYGKNYVAIGDSRTRGYAPANTDLGIAEGSQIPLPYPKYASEQLGLKLTNLGVDGRTVYTTIKSGVLDRIAEGETPDLITIMLGANDSAYLQLGTINDTFDVNADTCTYYAGYKYIIETLQTSYPKATIILLGNTWVNKTGTRITPYNEAVKALAEYYNVLYLDMQRQCGFNMNNDAIVNELQLGIHPNYKAHEIKGSRLAGFISSI